MASIRSVKQGAGRLVATMLLAAVAGPLAAQDQAVRGAHMQADVRDVQPAPPTATVARAPDRPRAFQVSLNAQWLGPSGLGARTATLTANQTGSSLPFDYFDADGQLRSAPGVEARLGYAITPRVTLEGGFAFSRPVVRVTIGDDFEGAPDGTFDAGRLSQYVFDGAIVFRTPPLARGRVRPFLQAGAGYLRQLHDTNTLAETGQVFYGGAGVTHLLSTWPGGHVSGIGLRGDVRLCYRRKGLSFGKAGQVYPAVSGGLFVAF